MLRKVSSTSYRKRAEFVLLRNFVISRSRPNNESVNFKKIKYTVYSWNILTIYKAYNLWKVDFMITKTIHQINMSSM